VRQKHYQRKRRLHAKIDGEDLLLQLAELWAREGAESDDAADEGLRG